MKQTRERRGFTLVELMVVILIVGILAAVAVPILRGRVEQAKWSEGAATAGAIRTAVRAAFAEDPEQTLTGFLSTASLRATLGFQEGDLTGRYFSAGNFEVTAVDSDTGNATIEVSAPSDLSGLGTLDDSGWNYDPDGGS